MAPCIKSRCKHTAKHGLIMRSDLQPMKGKATIQGMRGDQSMLSGVKLGILR